MKIGIQGTAGSYHEQVAQNYFGSDVTIEYIDTFRHVFDALRKGEIDKGVIAIANNRYGFVSEAFNELIKRHDEVRITGESYLRVQHQLLGLAGANLESIKEVHSQAPALGQCHDFLSEKLPHVPLVEQEDTAASAEHVAKLKDPSIAAIASKRAGELHGLEIIAENIQDDTDNFTRFLILEPSSEQPNKGNKTTMLLKTPQVAGSLVQALLPFQKHGVNISTLHSSYLPNTGFDMQFFLEFDSGVQSESTDKILAALKESGCEYTILGSYDSNEQEMAS